jgi:hypothetical protein
MSTAVNPTKSVPGSLDRSITGTRASMRVMTGQLTRLQVSPIGMGITGSKYFTSVRSGLTTAGAVCERLLHHRIPTKDTPETVDSFAPPLVITQAQIDRAIERLAVRWTRHTRSMRPDGRIVERVGAWRDTSAEARISGHLRSPGVDFFARKQAR